MALRSRQKSSSNPDGERVAPVTSAPSPGLGKAHRHENSDGISTHQGADRDRLAETLAKSAREGQASIQMRRILESASRPNPADIFRQEVVTVASVARLVLQRRLHEATSALREVENAQAYTPPLLPVRIRVVRAEHLPQPLTYLEMEILKLMAQGFTNPQMSAHCKIALSTTRRHVRNVLKKLGAKHRVEELRRACSLGLVHSYIS
jgi:DNA-binding NarL/FixJ family response regulator